MGRTCVINYQLNMKKLLTIALSLMALSASAQNEYEIKVESRQPSGIIDEMLYGQLFEHIYFSANNGVWQEMIYGRSFELDLIPDITEEEFNRAFDNPQTKTVNALPASLPRALREEILKLADIPGDSYVKDLRKGQRREIYKRCRTMRFKISLLPPIATATVTRGGISLKEIDRETMGIIKIPGAYVAGEALDVDGRSGGYNLQLAMSTAYSAVQDMIKSKRNREKEGG